NIEHHHQRAIDIHVKRLRSQLNVLIARNAQSTDLVLANSDVQSLFWWLVKGVWRRRQLIGKIDLRLCRNDRPASQTREQFGWLAYDKQSETSHPCHHAGCNK